MSIKISVFASLVLWLSQSAAVTAQDQQDPDRALPCGPELTCDASAQYCSVVVGGPGGMATGHTCVDVPTAEGSVPPTCDTITVPIGSECADTEDGVVVTTRAP